MNAARENLLKRMRLMLALDRYENGEPERRERLRGYCSPATWLQHLHDVQELKEARGLASRQWSPREFAQIESEAQERIAEAQRRINAIMQSYARLPFWYTRIIYEPETCGAWAMVIRAGETRRVMRWKWQ